MIKMKVLLILITLILIDSCGVEADKVGAGNSFIERRNFLGLSSIEDIEIDNNIRTTTFLIYPNPSDLEEFEFNTPTLQSWQGIKEILPYGNKIDPTIPLEMNSFEKATQVIFTIISAGQARDDAFLALKKAEEKSIVLVEKKKTISEEIDGKMDTLKDQIKEYKNCYYKDKPADGEKYICKLDKDDEFTSRKRISSCEQFLEVTFIELEAETQGIHDQINTDCEAVLIEEQAVQVEISSIQGELDELGIIIKKNSQFRDDGKQVVIDLLEKGVEQFNPNVFLTTGAENESDNDLGPYSVIKFSEDKKSIDEFVLMLDLGKNYSEGAGFKEYSLANGKITNLKYFQKGQLETVLQFNLVTKDFVIEAELFESIQQYHGLRYVGDLIVRYPNGTIREGVGKIEISEKN